VGQGPPSDSSTCATSRPSRWRLEVESSGVREATAKPICRRGSNCCWTSTYCSPLSLSLSLSLSL
jgi:hypothetical protein